MQVVETLRPGQQLGFADALGELVPGNHRLDGGIGVAAGFLGLQQRLADLGVQAHLVVDRLALLLELLLMLVLRAAEQLDQDAVMQIDQLIDHGRGALQHHGGQGRVAALRLELTEVFGRHLPTLAGQLEQAVLVDVPAKAFGQVHQLKCLQPLDVFQHVPRVGFQRCLAQPGQPGDAAAGLELQQLVQLGPMRVREWFDQGAVDPPIGSRNGFRASPVDHAQRRQDASLLPQALQRLAGQQQALVGLLGQFGQLAHQGAEVGQAERGQLKVGAQFLSVLATGHIALAVLRPTRRIGLDLLGHPQEDRFGQLAVSAQRIAGVAQQAELHRKAQTVGVAAPLADQ